jgi:LPXTG-site transpeptidase (sortase) family protein
MRPSSLPFTRILPMDEPQDPPLRREGGEGAESRSPTNGLRCVIVGRSGFLNHSENEPGKGAADPLPSSSSPGVAGLHHPAAPPCAVPSAGITPASREQAPAVSSVRNTRGADGPQAETPPREPTLPGLEEQPVTPSFVPFTEVVPLAGDHLGAPSVVRVAVLGLGVILAFLTIASSAAFWSQTVHGLSADALLAWASGQGAASHEAPAAAPTTLLQSPAADTAAESDRTDTHSEDTDQPAPPRATHTLTAMPDAVQSISVTASPLALTSQTYSSTLALLPGSAPTIMQPTPTPIPPSPTPTPQLPPPSPTPTPAAGPPPADSPPTRLTIPRLGLDVRVRPVGYSTTEKAGETVARWDTRPNAASFHNTSALPGHPGNTVINGHRDIYGAVFLELNKVKVGDQIVVFVGEEAYPHEVTEMRKVRYVCAAPEKQAEHLQLMGSFPEERLTLVTCTPVGLATHRLYVIAHPLSGEEAVPVR